jgi:hypothetical protein
MSSFIADNPAAAASPSPDDLRAQLQDAPPAQQLSLLPKLLSLGEPGQQVLMAFLQEQGGAPTVVTGRAYQLLRSLPDAPTVESFLTNHFPQGIYPLPAACEVDYSPIQAALAQQEFEAADRLTLQKMCELAGDNAVKRKWLYFTEGRSLFLCAATDYAAKITGTTDSVGIPPAPLDKGGGDSRGDLATR